MLLLYYIWLLSEFNVGSAGSNAMQCAGRSTRWVGCRLQVRVEAG